MDLKKKLSQKYEILLNSKRKTVRYYYENAYKAIMKWSI